MIPLTDEELEQLRKFRKDQKEFKFYAAAQDIVTLIPTINIMWDRNYRTGKLFFIDIFIPWGMWCIGFVWTRP